MKRISQILVTLIFLTACVAHSSPVPLAAQVVDDSGKPVPGAGVTVSGIVPEEGAAPDLSLVPRRVRTLQGRVISSRGGGVAGALVYAWPPFRGQAAVDVSESVTRLGGRFEVSLPDSSSLVNLAVFPPGHALRLTTVAVSPGQTLEIPVDTQGGALFIEVAEDGPLPMLVQNGTFLVMPMLKRWASLHGVRASDPTRLFVPRVSAGPYSLCVGAAAVSRLKEGAEPPAASCASGVLSPNGELVLKAPALPLPFSPATD